MKTSKLLLKYEFKKISSVLLEWFDKNQRELPWRKTKNPYYIWISEIMLQQTQVIKVIDYYQRFIKKFPSIQDLAQSNDQDLYEAWAGLGYYSRARNLRQACQILDSKNLNRLPPNYDDLLRLPGIGPYTAAAIASIAFNKVYAVVDGNVIRVIARLKQLKGHSKSETLKKNTQQEVDQLIDTQRPGDFNQAMMELGATVCRPKKPLCLFCPLSSDCLVFKKGEPEKYPEASPKPELKKIARTLLILTHQGQVYLTRRPEKSRWLKNMLSPLEHWHEEHSHGPDSKPALETWAKDYRINTHNLILGKTYQHRITKHQITTQTFHLELKKLNKYLKKESFFPLDDIDSIGLANLDRKALIQ